MGRKWDLTVDDPLALRLAADVRGGKTDYGDDQVWELDLAALGLRTVYGGRGWGRIDVVNGRLPHLHFFYPNYLQLSFRNEQNEVVMAEFWAASSHAVALRVSGEATIRAMYEVDGLLPVWVEGNGRYVLASRPEAETSYQLAQTILEQDWDVIFEQIHQLNQSTPEIYTGDLDWDAALAFAFKVSLQSYVGKTEHLPHPSFVFTRIPERGFSRVGDGSDHNWQWDGQVATEAYVNLPMVAYAAPELAMGVIRNYLAVQEGDGFIDWKPGLAGQRNGRLCIPLLAATVWHIYQLTEDAAFLREVYPGLSRFLRVWYTLPHDRDQDGVPEWDTTIQSAFDDQPSFVRYRAWAQRADITKVESPDLMAYLYQEHRAMQQIEGVLGLGADPFHEERAVHLEGQLATMWQPMTRSYHFRDRDSHDLPTQALLLAMVAEEGLTAVSQTVGAFLPKPNRVLVRLEANRQRPKLNLEVTIEGISQAGWSTTEVLTSQDFYWYQTSGSATGETLWQLVERVHVTGMSGVITELEIVAPDLGRQDQTLLLPLWAGMVRDAFVEPLVKRTVTDPRRYWRRYGMPNCSALDPAYRADNREGSGGVWLMWNTMMGEGLLRYGYRQEAAELITRLMTAMLHTLKTEKCFREAYNPDVLAGLGERDYLWGVAPCHLFMQAVGIRIISSSKVYLVGYNPFTWSVTVVHRGVVVKRPSGPDAETAVIFPPGVAGEVAADGSVRFQILP